MDLLLDALAVFRLTRLAVSDTVIEEQRARLLMALEANDHPKLVTLIGCPWCISPYVAVVVVIARRRYPRWWDACARVLAYSAVAGIVHHHTVDSH